MIATVKRKPSRCGGEAERLRQFSQMFDSSFRRCDQARWLEVYLSGLLGGGRRKNIEAVARELSGSKGPRVSDLAQALQNFVNQSPWDEAQIWKRLRDWLAPAGLPCGVAIEEIGFVRQGRHSVGVHRQYWATDGRKRNSQLAVGLFAMPNVAVRDVAFPVAAKLYLPRSWSGNPTRMVGAGVPADWRTGMSRQEIALCLLDECLPDLTPSTIVLVPERYGGREDFRYELLRRNLYFVTEIPGDTPLALPRGPDAETSAADLARMFPATDIAVRLPELDGEAFPFWLFTEARGDGTIPRLLLARLPQDCDVAQARQVWQARSWVHAALSVMNERLGLNHYEGRSWRGFHHHLCLVALAYAFLHQPVT